MSGGIVPPYLLRQIEAERRYPDDAILRAAFIAGAEWDNEQVWEHQPANPADVNAADLGLPTGLP